MNHQLIDELEQIGGVLKPASLRGCDEIYIEQPSFTAKIALWGGHLISFIPSGKDDLLFQSENPGSTSRFGRRHFGVPVCWPWFGANTEKPDYQSHGLARYFRWQLTEVSRFKNGDIKLVLKLASDDHPLLEEMWPQAFELRQVFRFGDGFQVNFSAANLSDSPLKVSEALHTYFRVGDSLQASVNGLEGIQYQDKFLGNARAVQQGDVMPCVDLDRVYLDAPAVTRLVDPVLSRTLRIETEGSASTVVWNPGEKLARERADMQDEDYRHFVCVESANALENAYIIEPGGIHQLRMSVQIEP